MKTLQILSQVKLPMAALVLLGIAELIVLDIGGNYLRILNFGGSWLTVGASIFIGIFSAAIMGWSALKLRLEYRELLTHGAMAGALVGFGAAAGICFFVLLLGLFGMGLEKLLPSSISSQGVFARSAAYLLVCLVILVAYPIMGALMGTMAGIISSPVRGQAVKKAAFETAGKRNASLGAVKKPLQARAGKK